MESVVDVEPKLETCNSTFNNDILKLLSIQDRQNLTTEEIQKKYIEANNQDINLFCSYTTRLDGFLDILLSWQILCSKEINELLGKVNTHRGDTMGEGTNFFSLNNYISLSTGFVSYAYSNGKNTGINSIEEYIGWVGIFLPTQIILQQNRISFSHCSTKGDIKNFDLNKGNFFQAIHKTRKKGELFDDGYGNVFEILIEALYENNEYSPTKKPLEYPRIDISPYIIAIPANMREKLWELLEKRQRKYKKLLEQIQNSKLNSNDFNGLKIDDREFRQIDKTLEFLSKMIKPININNLAIFWYKQKNLNIALQFISTNL